MWINTTLNSFMPQKGNIATQRYKLWRRGVNYKSLEPFPVHETHQLLHMSWRMKDDPIYANLI